LLYDSEARRTIYLIFQDSFSYLGSRFIKKGFRHVFAVEHQALGWICFDASIANIMTTILPAGFHDDVIGHFLRLNPHSTVVKLYVKPTKEIRSFKFGCLNCVSVVQYMLSIHWPFVLTPYQLYSKLVKNGAEHIEVTKIWAAMELEEVQSKQQMRRE
jgi:hypothetical protein